jgi:hypothetical protein
MMIAVGVLIVVDAAMMGLVNDVDEVVDVVNALYMDCDNVCNTDSDEGVTRES